MPSRVTYLVSDLFFSGKICNAAEQLGIEAERARDARALHAAAARADLVIVDLRLPDALGALELLAADPATAAVPSVGFIDHENVDAMDAARARGCRVVLSKRSFSAKLPELLSRPPA
jgi:CheY-like chemotaxis protein